MDLIIDSSTAYNSEEKKRLIESQSNMTFQEKLDALREMKMSDEERHAFILKEWKAFQKQANDIDIDDSEFDLSEIQFQMSIYDFAQYGFLKSEDIIEDYYNYIPVRIADDGVGHLEITLINCNTSSDNFRQIIQIQAGMNGPYRYSCI